MVLTDGEVTNRAASSWPAGGLHPARCTGPPALWSPTGSGGIDPCHGHLHGADIHDADAAYYAGFGWRYFTSIRACLTEYGGGVEWQEVVHPTRTRPLDALALSLRPRTSRAGRLVIRLAEPGPQ